MSNYDKALNCRNCKRSALVMALLLCISVFFFNTFCSIVCFFGVLHCLAIFLKMRELQSVYIIEHHMEEVGIL